MPYIHPLEPVEQAHGLRIKPIQSLLRLEAFSEASYLMVVET